jgi:hypothetical protein
LIPDVADTAPSNPVLTVYDEEHLITYLRLLDADVEGADWREVARLVLHIDPDHEPDRARRTFESHLSRAQLMTEDGYRHLSASPKAGAWRECRKGCRQYMSNVSRTMVGKGSQSGYFSVALFYLTGVAVIRRRDYVVSILQLNA